MSKIYQVEKKQDYLYAYEDIKQYSQSGESDRHIKFIVRYNDIENTDRDLLLYYYLLVNYYIDITFSLEVHVKCAESTSAKMKDAFYYSICAYAYIQHNSLNTQNQRSSVIVFEFNVQQNDVRYFQRRRLSGIQKNLPIISIDKECYRFLKSPVKKWWNKIKQFKTLQLNNFNNIVLYLCGNALFGDTQYRQLTRIRRLVFGSSLFEKSVFENTVLSLLIFSLYDFHLRGDLTEKYFRSLDNPRALLKENDFFKEFQAQQKREYFERYLDLRNNGNDIKTFLKRKDTVDIKDSSILEAVVIKIRNEMKKVTDPDVNLYWEESGSEQKELGLKRKGSLLDQFQEEWLAGKKDNQWIRRFSHEIEGKLAHYSIHPQIIKELYEAVIISEGLLQLIENTVYHAGNQGDDGRGVMDMRIVNIEDERDKDLICSHFTNKDLPLKYKNKYWMLINIADISTVHITEKFYENNQNIIEAIRNEDPEIADILTYMPLKGFFRPSEEQRTAWRRFYNYGSGNDRAVNHFGLQIFDSIVSSKGGTFWASSGKDLFGEPGKLLPIPGTVYRIIFPLDEKSHRDDNIYDAMLGYNIQNYIQYADKEMVFNIMPKIIYKECGTLGEKEQYIQNIAKSIQEVTPKTALDFYQFDLSENYNVECLIKGMLLFVFGKDNKEPLKFAFVNCEQYHMLEIVRLIALYYDRQEENRRMENVQIYIKGKEVGDELLLYGETLTTLRDNLALSACIKGTMYQNLNVINTILSRRNQSE